MQPPSNPGISIIPGDLSSGMRFPPPVRTLVAENNPSVSGPPGRSADFLARAGLFSHVEKPLGGFSTLCE
jgi:hypothetical protein